MVVPLHAHRLGRDYGPDSSWQALAGALAAGVDGVETDVCLTGDERLILLHDPLLELGTTVGGWAHERRLEEIRSGRLRDRDGRITDQRPLELDDVLDAVPADLVVQAEVKAHTDPELAARTARVLCERYRRRPDRRRIEVISFHSAAVAIAAALGYRSRLVLHAEYAPEALAAWAVARGLAGVSVEHFLLSPHLVAVLRLAGLSVCTGTVNHPELLRRVVDLARPDAVCTDRPGELRAEAGALAAGARAAA
ncbi:MAG TPA: glycerophosphodiester phosphodiesterase family protein [Solirubrobacterales bacterium]|nr:glycerophosphodiester phosphodiesterase family protein [Solirubrobacterales bacterium]